MAPGTWHGFGQYNTQTDIVFHKSFARCWAGPHQSISTGTVLALAKRRLQINTCVFICNRCRRGCGGRSRSRSRFRFLDRRFLFLLLHPPEHCDRLGLVVEHSSAIFANRNLILVGQLSMRRRKLEEYEGGSGATPSGPIQFGEGRKQTTQTTKQKKQQTQESKQKEKQNEPNSTTNDLW